jgi:ELWxxDGT repeat protein
MRNSRQVLAALVLASSLCWGHRALSDGSPYLVKDLGVAQTPGLAAGLNEAIVSANKLYFIGSDGFHFVLPFVSDGTAAGTGLVRDVGGFGWFGASRLLTGLSGSAFFFAPAEPGLDAPTSLWRTDGTASGTTIVAKLPQYAVPSRSVATLTKIFFVEGLRLWVSDGSPAGTRVLLQFDGTPALETLADRAYFLRDSRIFVTDGTPFGTALLKDLSLPGSTAFLSNLNRTDDRLFVSLLRAPAGTADFSSAEVWVSDGTAAGTTPVLGIPYSSGLDLPREFAKVGNRTFFSLVVGGESRLYVTDGTLAGTHLIWSSLSFFPPAGLKSIGTVLTFSFGDRLWKSDGTSSGTSMLGNVGASFGSGSTSFEVVGGRLFFEGSDPSTGVELWVTDGTSPGTNLVADLSPGPAPSGLSHFNDLGGTLVFFSQEQGLMKSDGTGNGTTVVTPLKVDTSDSDPQILGETGGKLLFAVPDSVFGSPQLWSSDGTDPGTSLLATVPGLGFGIDFMFSAVKTPSLTFFLNRATSGGTELWKTDGTSAGTALVADNLPPFPIPSPPSPNPPVVAVLGNSVFFPAIDAEHGTELWKSDGTSAGTVLVKDLVPGPVSSGIDQLTRSGDGVFFTATNPVDATTVLWRTDGTADGTSVLRSFGGFVPERLSDLQGTLLFFVRVPGSHELWRTDGTPGGTTFLRSFPSVSTTVPGAVAGGLLFFGWRDSLGSAQLWRTDGTASGTILLASEFPEDLTTVGGQVFFAATDAAHGRELWRSDGTPKGTGVVTDLAPGVEWGDPRALTAVGARLYFKGTDGVHGREVWRSDGTPGGTLRVTDLFPGAGSSTRPFERMASAGGNLFFGANEGLHGMELWALPLDPPPSANLRTLAPCRLLDTRAGAGLLAGPALVAGETRTFPGTAVCGVPSTARQLSVNVTVVTPGGSGSLRVFPQGTVLPLATAISFRAGRTRANNAIFDLGMSGQFNVYCDTPSGTVDLVVDVNGWFE